MKIAQFYIVFLLLFLMACCDDMPDEHLLDDEPLTDIVFDPTAYELNIPEGFPPMDIPADNPLTDEGVELGKMLFYDPILSLDSLMSCASCHLQAGAFTDNLPVSRGVRGEAGIRSSMSLLNVGFVNTGLFWDGRVMSLEQQALLPVEDPIELHESWPNVEFKLKRHQAYPELFRKAFGIGKKGEITKELAVKAIAQFERTIVSSGKAKYDRVLAGLDVFTDLELDGHDIFFDINPDMTKHAECGHCHNAPLFTTNEFFNNGIEAVADLNSFPDDGLGSVTGIMFDNGKFRTPTLRNIANSAPYMHDGRFDDLDAVIDHYTTGGHPAINLDPVLRELSLDSYDREALKAFIMTLQDDDFLQNPALSNPF